jgi:hypothetical protein
VITEQAHADKILAVRDTVESIEQVVVVDGEPPPGTIALDELAAAPPPTSTSTPRGTRSSRTTF